MGLFSRKPKSGQHFILVFDIGSASIGGAFVSIDTAKKPEIIFSTRKTIPFQEKLDFGRFLDSMIKTLEEMFQTMQKTGGGVRVDRAFCILASPWYASQTRLVHYNQPQPFTVTEKGLAKLVEKEIELFRNSKLFSRPDDGEAAPEIMEAKSIQVKLNGYEVRDPFKKKTTKLEVALYISMIPANICRSINESIKRFWHVPDAHFSSFSFTAFDSVRDIFTEESSFLFMDISGEVTDISLAKDNVLLESISFPAGKNMLVRALVAGMKTAPAAAQTELRLYLENKSNREHREQVEKILSAAAKEWLVFFEDALSQFSTEFPIPRTIFYTADDDVMKWYENAMKETDFSRFSREEGTFNIRSLGNSFLSKFVEVLEPDFQDPFIAIEAMFANKLAKMGK
jgi:hypothetical protein